MDLDPPKRAPLGRDVDGSGTTIPLPLRRDNLDVPLEGTEATFIRLCRERDGLTIIRRRVAAEQE
jgi:hypothetical protein